nr:MAG TPA: NTP-PPase-like protein [Caudoviricetes sp.]DAP85540.1 MAG TPA: NTP-PPase-like protein [Caudoviricetes sp.]
MTTLKNVKQWFIDRDLENGGRLDKQSLKLSEEFGESIQLKMLFYKKLRNLTTDRFLTFRESDWKFFIRDLVNEFVH